ncbi:uncharacterized protein METZ01_LOCUS434771, partial [marine metagenome]
MTDPVYGSFATGSSLTKGIRIKSEHMCPLAFKHRDYQHKLTTPI